jgi:hypothetical protein
MIEISNFLNGVNLCNIFASLVVDEINKKSPNSVTEINVTDVGNFYVVRGVTSSKEVIDVNKVFQDFTKQYPKRFQTSLRLFDLIQYDKKITDNRLMINYVWEKSKRLNDIQEFVDNSSKKNIFYNLSICDKSKTVFYECLDEDVNQTYYEIEQFFEGYVLSRTNQIKKSYSSDRYYGLSNNGEKFFHVLVKNIKHCLFMMGISNKLNISISSNLSLENINNEVIGLDIKDSSFIVSKDWLESLLLDVFPFSLSELENYFDLTDYSSSQEILKNDCVLPFEKLDLIKEIILI